jgi:NAD(P)-dependent dehydrogenase (short-subunit alcohol dehydrogenase family)
MSAEVPPESAEVPPEASVVDQFRLDGHTALITGGGRGIGRAIALVYAGAGANVIVASRSKDEVQAVCREVESLGVGGMALVADVSDPEDVRTMASAARELGHVDIVVNNAGNLVYKPLVPLPGPGLDGRWTSPGAVTDEEWFTTLNTHVSSSFFLLRELAPAMLENRWGRVINITSGARGRTVPFCAPYEVAKGALASLTRTLAHEWATYNVTVNAIAPGHFHTTMSADLHEIPSSREWMLRRIPMHREGELSELGAMALYLASDAAAYVTGQELFIDGGESL